MDTLGIVLVKQREGGLFLRDPITSGKHLVYENCQTNSNPSKPFQQI